MRNALHRLVPDLIEVNKGCFRSVNETVALTEPQTLFDGEQRLF